MHAMLEAGDPEDFNQTTGEPNLPRLKERVGFEVSASERKRLWAEIEKAPP